MRSEMTCQGPGSPRRKLAGWFYDSLQGPVSLSVELGFRIYRPGLGTSGYGTGQAGTAFAPDGAMVQWVSAAYCISQ